MKPLLNTTLLLLCLLAAPAQAATATGFDDLDGLIRRSRQAVGQQAGTAVAVVRDGKIVYQGYFGQADIRGGVAVDADTVFYIASATKPMFALEVLRRQALGELDTQMTLRQMFPDAPLAGVDADRVTLADLLVHRSGLDNPGLAWATAFSGVHDAQTRRALAGTSAPDPESAYGSFNYSNVGYNIASVWMEQRFGQPWQQQLETGILAPLGMRHSSTRISQAHAAGWSLARPYSIASSSPETPLYLTKVDATLHAAGGVVASAPDLARWLLLQLGSTTTPGLSAALVARSQQPQVALDAQYMDFPRQAYAWGWYIGPYQGHPLLHHFGSFAGFHAHLSFMPDSNTGLVVLSNEDVVGAELANLIAAHVYATALGDTHLQAEAAQRFAALPARVAQIKARIATQRAAILARPWHLSSDPCAYAGVYSHPLLGDMRVDAAADNSLHLQWGQLSSSATGAEPVDRVRVEFAPNAGVFIDFQRGQGGIISLLFEGNVFLRRQ